MTTIGPQPPATRVIYGDTLPASCSVGQIFIVTSGSVGMYACFTTDTWTLLDAGPDTGEVTGAGTTNRLTKWINGSGSIIGDSALLDDGVTVNSIRPFTASNVSAGFATTATAASTTTLTIASKGIQEFTGSTTQDCVLPVVSTLPRTGWTYFVINRSSGVVTVKSSGGNTIQAMAANTSAIFTCVSLSGTGAGSWDVTYISSGGSSNTGTASVLLASQSVDLNDGTHTKQPIYTCPASRRAVITNIVMQEFSGTVTSALLNIGWNANADDVTAEMNLPGLGASSTQSVNCASRSETFQLMLANPVIGTAGDVLGLKNTQAEGSALTAIVDVFGYLTDTSGVPQANINVP